MNSPFGVVHSISECTAIHCLSYTECLYASSQKSRCSGVNVLIILNCSPLDATQVNLSLSTLIYAAKVIYIDGYSTRYHVICRNMISIYHHHLHKGAIDRLNGRALWLTHTVLLASCEIWSVVNCSETYLARWQCSEDSCRNFPSLPVVAIWKKIL